MAGVGVGYASRTVQESLGESRPDPRGDVIRTDLEAYLQGTWKRPALRVTAVVPIPTGHSGFTYFIDTEEGARRDRYVLRLPPPGARASGPADVVRQGRIMAALNRGGLPVPAVPAITSEPVIDGRPLVLMAAVAGERIETAGPKHPGTAIAAAAITVLKRLHAVAPGETGIGDEPPVGLEAEMMRWHWLMERAPEELTTRAHELGGLLANQRPAERPPTLVHGDYHLGNMLFSGAEVVAVLDWEIAQIGQPLLDLGCLCVMVQRRRFEGAPNPSGEGVEVSIAELAELYGVGAGEMNWYVAMSLYKYAAILGYNLMLHRRGKRPDPMYEGLTTTIAGMIDDGISLLS